MFCWIVILVRSLSATIISAMGRVSSRERGESKFGDWDHKDFLPVAKDLAGEDAEIEDAEEGSNHCIVTVFQDSDAKPRSACGCGIRGMVD